jgi:hypothetical protein
MKQYDNLTWELSIRGSHFIRVLKTLKEFKIPYDFYSHNTDIFTVYFKFENEADEAYFIMIYDWSKK